MSAGEQRVDKPNVSPIPWWGYPVRLASAAAVNAYVGHRYRVRRFGDLPPMRGPGLIVSNHQIDLDLMAMVSAMALNGGWRAPLYSASARMMHEPGFIALRIPWLQGVLNGVNLSFLFGGMGMLPIENQLLTRPLLRWAGSVERCCGPLPIERVFSPKVLLRFGEREVRTDELFSKRYFLRALETPVKITELLPPHSRQQLSVTRKSVERDLARIAETLRAGGIFFVTPEGEYSRDGRMLRFRGIWDLLAPLADVVHLAGVSYDPFAPGRFSQMYRIVRLQRKGDVERELAACRPITRSAVLCKWVKDAQLAFTVHDALTGVRRMLDSLPSAAFVDPEFAADPAARIRETLQEMERRRVVTADGGRYRVAATRRHPAFANVDDVVAFQAAFFSETVLANEPRIRVITGSETMTKVDESRSEHSHAI
jgi:hypothetical protein